jgi:hypothetical protein
MKFFIIVWQAVLSVPGACDYNQTELMTKCKAFLTAYLHPAKGPRKNFEPSGLLDSDLCCEELTKNIT